MMMPQAELNELESLRKENKQLKGLFHNALRLGGKFVFVDFPEFALSALQGGVISWNGLPQKWKDDPDLVCCFFERSEMPPFERSARWRLLSRRREPPLVEWKDLPYQLKMNEKVLLQALRTPEGPKWEDVPKHFQSNTEVITTAVLYKKIDFEKVPEDLQQTNREIALFGIKNNYLMAEDCPCLEPEFLKEAIEGRGLQWDDLPVALQNDIDFVHSINISKLTSGMPKQILQHAVGIRNDRTFWLKLIELVDFGSSATQKFKEYEVPRLLDEFAPVEFFSDQIFMLRMIEFSTDAFSLVNSDLKNDRAFLETALSRNAAILKILTNEEHQQHADLVIKAIPLLNKARENDVDFVLHQVAKALPKFFWFDHNFVQAWILAGFGLLDTIGFEIHDVWRQNRSLCLANAIHCRRYSQYDLHLIRPHSSDPAFMRELLEHRPEAFQYTSGAARSDPAVMTTAFAGDPKVAAEELLKLHFEDRNNEIQKYLDYLHSQLDLFQTFSTCILGNMLSTQSVESTGTNLTLLNQGLETSIEYKKQLAAYVGVPVGMWLRRLQKAEEHVHNTIEPFAHRFTI